MQQLPSIKLNKSKRLPKIHLFNFPVAQVLSLVALASGVWSLRPIWSVERMVWAVDGLVIFILDTTVLET